ncbi:YihY family inner membrane protein, partial [Pseudomonadales bacterium]|nr:YihY family inner membrane protein [Pseudomonadales bacterium]
MGFIEQYIKVPPLFRQIWAFFYLMSERFIEDSCRSTAAALTFQTLFAVVPLLTVMYTIFNAFEAFDGLSGTVQEFIFTNVVPENVAVVREYLDEFSTSATNLGVPSGILVSVTALLMLFTIERTFNDIWRVKEPRHGFQRFLVYWAILTLGPAVLAITAYTLTLPLISDVTEITGIIQYLPVLLSVSMFTLLYMAVPNCAVSFKHALIGGVVVSI